MKARHRSWFFASLLTFASVLSAEKIPARNIICHGWDSPGTAYIRAHWQEMEKMPFDGVDFTQRGKTWLPESPGKNCFSHARFGALPRFFPPALLPAEYLAAIEEARR